MTARKGFVPIGPVRDHIAQLRAAGIGTARIAELSGLQRRTVRVVMTGHRTGGVPPQATVSIQTAERILAVRPAAALVAGRRLIDATGTRRRLQALIALGWSRAALAREAGMLPATIGRLAVAETCWIDAARTVHGLYEELWDQAPPEGTAGQRQAAARSRADARRRGWVLPLSWDEEALDDPAARPVVALAGRISARERLDELVWLADSGVRVEDAARRVGYGDARYAQSVAIRAGHRAAGLFGAVAA